MKTGTHQAAILLSPNAPLELQVVDTMIPRAHQLLIKVKAIAVNPSDWKMQEAKKGTDMPCILGSDVAGIIESVGQDCSSSLKIGDRVAAFAGGIWSNQIEEGGFQEFVLVRESNALLLPQNIEFEDAVVLPMALATAAGAIWHTLQIPRPQLPTLAAIRNQAIPRIWGIFFSGPACYSNWLKSWPNRHCHCNDTSDLPDKIAQVLTQKSIGLVIGLDAISQGETIIKAAEVLSRCAGSRTAKLAVTLAIPEGISIPSNVKVERTSASHFHANEENAQWLFHDYVPWALQHKKLRPAPPARMIKGGLGAVQSAFENVQRRGQLRKANS